MDAKQDHADAWACFSSRDGKSMIEEWEEQVLYRQYCKNEWVENRLG